MLSDIKELSKQKAIAFYLKSNFNLMVVFATLLFIIVGILVGGTRGMLISIISLIIYILVSMYILLFTNKGIDIIKDEINKYKSNKIKHEADEIRSKLKKISSIQYNDKKMQDATRMFIDSAYKMVEVLESKNKYPGTIVYAINKTIELCNNFTELERIMKVAYDYKDKEEYGRLREKANKLIKAIRDVGYKLEKRRLEIKDEVSIADKIDIDIETLNIL